MGSSNNTGLTDSSDTQKLKQEDADSSPYSVGEMVLVSCGHYYYAAKGWSKKWDEWVTTDRLMTYTEENVQKHLAINKKQGIHKSTELARSSNFKEKSTNVLASGKKRKSDDRRFMENINITMEMCAKIQIPLGLRKHLVDDCEFITCMGKVIILSYHRASGGGYGGDNSRSWVNVMKQMTRPNAEQQNGRTNALEKGQAAPWKGMIECLSGLMGRKKSKAVLPRLPRHPNVSEIFQWYIQHRTEQKEPSADSVHEIMKGLQCYFDKALPLRLLYSEERQQYERAMAAYDLTPSHVYGAEHLLRLFVLMPELLYHANMEEEALVELIENFNDFLKYLRMNQGACFRSDCYIADAADDTDSSTDKPEDIV
ncbi:hypothetical protein G4B88_015782 [Cannabis sativa]|uniref:MRG domain-containing protein n=1 Tax=Cannabis sativa TaxID=3483 RepID=A0A7J6ESI1_CANSA|nr:hypothetical protein G4B88_015782 [Cannabis sativa]